MSRFFSSKYKNLTPYTPGEQPKDFKYIKLNTNESPYPPSKRAIKGAMKASKLLNLYPDPTCSALNLKMAEILGVSPEEILMTNCSDEILNFAFMAFCDEKTPVVFPDITYGFYSVFAELNNVPYEEIPLKEDFSIDTEAFMGQNKTIFIANPNAPTGICLPLSEIEKILKSNPNNIVVIDEAYIDFGGESAVSLVPKYDNLLVTQTFSKSRSMAGARLGFGVAQKELIAGLNTIKYSTNPYNINKMTMAAGIGILEDNDQVVKNCKEIIKTREFTKEALKDLGFTLTPSSANFIFAKHKEMGGEKIYKKLKEAGILVRHFNSEKIKDYNRITIGTKKQMKALISALKTILEEN